MKWDHTPALCVTWPILQPITACYARSCPIMAPTSCITSLLTSSCRPHRESADWPDDQRPSIQLAAVPSVQLTWLTPLPEVQAAPGSLLCRQELFYWWVGRMLWSFLQVDISSAFILWLYVHVYVCVCTCISLPQPTRFELWRDLKFGNLAWLANG